jgi:streptomycin 6-kinase
VVEAFGSAGEEWLRQLPLQLEELCQRWDLTLGEAFDLSYNYVTTVRQADGSDAVLKTGVPREELSREIRALRLYAGDAACNLLKADEERGAMLLERLRPGDMLADLARTDDEAATRIGAQVMRKLWSHPVPSESHSEFRPLAEWFAAFERHRAAHEGSPGPFPAHVFERAEKVSAELLESAPRTVLLHADFHHFNVLQSERGWLAIDPKGMLGDPGYEVGPFLCNPSLSTRGILGRRLDILAEELNHDRTRLRDWGIAYAVLSASWSAEDHGDGWQDAIATAELLMQL